MLIIKNTTKEENIIAASGHAFPAGQEVPVMNDAYTRLLQDNYIQTQIKIGALVVTNPVPAVEDETTEDVTREWLAQATKKQVTAVLDAHFQDGDSPEYPAKLDDLRQLAASVLFLDA
jgi:DNA-binding transcriptional regulator YhcF (GntR family)